MCDKLVNFLKINSTNTLISSFSPLQNIIHRNHILSRAVHISFSSDCKNRRNAFEDCYYMRTPRVIAEISLTSLWGEKRFFCAGRHSSCIHHHYQQPSRECTCVCLSHGVCVASGKLWLVSRVWFNWLKSYQLCNI